MCPMGAAAEWANKKGLQRIIPKWLRWEGTPIISFIIITILGQTTGVRDHAVAMAYIFGGTMIIAIIMGFIYGRNKRAWCRHACPIGLLLGIFSRLGAVQFIPKRFKKGGDKWSEKTVCPTMIDINRKQESRHCIECFACVHPEKKGGVRFRLRKIGEEIEQITHHNPNIFEIWFLFMATGLAIGGFMWLILPSYDLMRGELAIWFIERDILWIGNSGPRWLMSVYPEKREVFNWLDFFMITSYMLGWMVIMSIMLGATNAMSSYLSIKAGVQKPFKRVFSELGYLYAPVAMVSLIIGLGGELFKPLDLIHPEFANILKITLFVGSFVWSIYLGFKILNKQFMLKRYTITPLIPAFIGCTVIFIAWMPAII
jgi:hypothetical protein